MSCTAAMAFSEREMARYIRDGFIVRRRIFAAQEVKGFQLAAARASIAALGLCEQGYSYALDGKRFVDAGDTTIQFEHTPGSQLIRVIEPVHQLDTVFDELVDDPRITLPMRQLVGAPKIALWTDKLNLKPPRQGSGFGWHQDSPYWIHDCDHVDQLPNVMITFDDASLDNGCFRIIRASHARGILPGTSDGSQLGGFFTDPTCFDEADQIAMQVPAGSAIFFNPHCVHGSLPNHSDRPRRAIVITYQPAGHPMLKSAQPTVRPCK